MLSEKQKSLASLRRSMTDANEKQAKSTALTEEDIQKMEKDLKRCETSNPSKRFCREGAHYHSALPVGSVLF